MQSSDLKHVLIVDDEKEVLEVIKVGLSAFKNQFTVVTRQNGREAIELLESQPIDMVVTDLKMPEVDGLELLAYMTASFPSLPVIVISGFGTPENMQKLDELGIYLFMDKPLSVQKLSRYIIEGLQEASQNGSVSGISIAGFLQLIEAEQKTCLLEVQGKGKRIGLLYFRRGKLYDAVLNHQRGEQAALSIIAWEYAKLSFRNIPRRTIKRRINISIMQLILESSRLKDETNLEQITDASSKASSEQDVYDDAEWEQLIENSINNSQPETEGGDQEKTELQEDASKELPFIYKQTFNYAERSNFMAGLKETLKDMTDEMDGVIAVGVAGMDGITVAENNPGGADMDAIAAKFAMLMKLGQRATSDIKGMGEFEENLIQSQNAWVLTRFLNKNYYLVIAVNREGTLGNARLVAKKYADRFQSAL
ncbi:response regulator [Desulfococcaceae bacterium HSG9]|nr:response regulator [Desulfococcaceae bacterium HSG9]